MSKIVWDGIINIFHNTVGGAAGGGYAQVIPMEEVK